MWCFACSFDINEVTGLITVRRCHNLGTCIDYETQPDKTYLLEVTAADRQGEGFYVRTAVNITVIDANDNEPIFTQNEYGISVRENRSTFVPPLFVVVSGM